MKIGGLVVMWVGVVYLLKNMGFIEMVNWAIVWPVILIILGSAMKHGCRGMCFGKGCGWCKGGMSEQKCEGGMCGMGKCEGGECKH